MIFLALPQKKKKEFNRMQKLLRTGELMSGWEKYIRKVEPYTPGEQPNLAGMIKLNTNECPYPPTPRVKKALKQLTERSEELRLYPDFAAKPLVESLAAYYKLEPEQVFVGVGSDDVLSVAFQTFFNSEKPILFPDITYSFYDVWAEMYRILYQRIALDEEFRICREDYDRENGGIVIANPNAPTSIAEGTDFIEDILHNNPDSVVIVDEAYIDFGAVSALPLIKKYDNLLVVQTFSKSRAMAGMRIGYAMGNKTLIKAMNHVKYSVNSYTMNAPSILCGVCAVEDDAYFKDCCQKVIATREWTRKELAALGFTCLDSSANFLFASHQTIPAESIFKLLREKNIFVRYFKKPRIDNYLRITIGTDSHMKILMNALSQIVGNR